MGRTLSNGVYLPDEGERNCYAGLKVNWEILNQKVADISALQLAIAGALHREIVASLPTTDIDPNTIYMILSGTSATENVYNEYMYVNNAWELIGTSATDLTNYYTKGDVDGLLVLKANASDLTSHTGDTTIHVTASDKTKWTNSANTHVLRLALSALTPSTSNNSFSNLDDSTALKVGDKVMDTAGVLFEVTAIDTQNSTFTIGTALIDLAQDSDVVHKSGDETIAGFKTFSSTIRLTAYPNIRMYLFDDEWNVQPTTNKQSEIRFTDKNSVVVSYFAFQHRTDSNEPFRTCWRQQKMDGTAGYYSIDFNNLGDFYPENNNTINLGGSSNRWKSVYATNYYYGNDNVEFSSKFVTTDTDQTIGGVKSFSDNISTKKIISNVAQLQINAKSSADSVAIIAGANATEGGGIWLYGKDHSNNSSVAIQVYDTANSTYHAARLNMDGSFTPTVSNNGLGSKSFKWVAINGLSPSSLGMPDLDNGIDISSYITVVSGGNKESFYTPPANGWISVALTRSGGTNMAVMLKQGNFASSGHNIAQENGTTSCNAMLPVKGGVQVSINSALADGIDFAYFYPCLGNV